MTPTADAVVIGAGIAGITAAYELAVRRGVGDVVIVDPRAPMSLTSDKSTECFRNWWPRPEMVGIMNDSIDVIEEVDAESGSTIGLERRGYLFVTGSADRLQEMSRQAEAVSRMGGGELRQHDPTRPYPQRFDGADLLGPRSLAEHFPYLTERAVGALHARRAGWYRAQQLGSWMLERMTGLGGRVVIEKATDIVVSGGRVEGVALGDGSRLWAPVVVIAAGPLARRVASWAGLELPLFSEVHLKVAFRDHLGVIPRDAPMIIWSDPQRIGWSAEEAEELEKMGRTDLLGELPVFCHGRPEGGEGSPYFLALWEYHRHVMEDPVFPVPDDPLYPEVVMRGLATMVPGLEAYLDRLPASSVDGGYYTKTTENLPLIGPAGPDGLILDVGMSGFGVMIAPGAASLVGAHVTGDHLPPYAPGFLLDRYANPAFTRDAEGSDSGQL